MYSVWDQSLKVSEPLGARGVKFRIFSARTGLDTEILNLKL